MTKDKTPPPTNKLSPPPVRQIREITNNTGMDGALRRPPQGKPPGGGKKK
jgi:hypothetical protein